MLQQLKMNLICPFAIKIKGWTWFVTLRIYPVTLGLIYWVYKDLYQYYLLLKQVHCASDYSSINKCNFYSVLKERNISDYLPV